MPDKPLEDGIEWHYPFAQYMGPGTHIIDKVLNNIEPTSALDAISLVHDINYLKATANPSLLDRADDLALTRATELPLTVQRSAFKAGLYIRKMFNLKVDDNSDRKDYYATWGNVLQNMILKHESYSKFRKEYGITISDFV